MYIPGTPNNHFLMDVWWNNHFSCKDLESSNWNNHFKVDVSGSRYILFSVAPFPLLDVPFFSMSHRKPFSSRSVLLLRVRRSNCHVIDFGRRWRPLSHAMSWYCCFCRTYTPGSTNIAGWKMYPDWRCIYFLLEMVIFHVYVSLPEGTCWIVER